MEFFSIILNWASMVVRGLGSVIAISGQIDFNEGKNKNLADQQTAGMIQIVGGVIIIAVGVFLVPKLADLLALLQVLIQVS